MNVMVARGEQGNQVNRQLGDWGVSVFYILGDRHSRESGNDWGMKILIKDFLP
jgi:hypothetical protein